MRTKTSPHHQFSVPLLQAMYALTGGKANVKVKHTAAVEATCQTLGLTLDSNGVQPQTGQQWNVRYTSLAMLDHRKSGLMDFPVKGWWVLTEAGVQVAAGEPPVEELAPVVTPEPPKASKHTKPAEKVPVLPVQKAAPVSTPPVQPPRVADIVDSYLLSLQIQGSSCFGYWSSQSSVCQGCSLAPRCEDAKFNTMAGIASTLLAEEATRKAEAEKAQRELELAAKRAASPAPVNPAPTPAQVKPTPATPGPGPKGPLDFGMSLELTVVADVLCAICNQTIPKGTVVFYSRKNGFAHKGCAAK